MPRGDGGGGCLVTFITSLAFMVLFAAMLGGCAHLFESIP